jgi:hypothetical protein
MPAITRWFIKTSFVYFILALILGIVLGLQALGKLSFTTTNLYPTYIHVLAEGWITMLIIGVAIWMFPKFTLDRPRGNEALGWTSYILLNAGLVLRIISEPLVGATGNHSLVWALVLTLAAGLQWLGGMAFVVNAWGRVKVK